MSHIENVWEKQPPHLNEASKSVEGTFPKSPVSAAQRRFKNANIGYEGLGYEDNIMIWERSDHHLMNFHYSLAAHPFANPYSLTLPHKP